MWPERREGLLMAAPNDPAGYDIDREYRARVPFMAAGALILGGGGALIGVQFVVGLGLGLIAFAIFGVAVVVFCALVGGTVGALVGLIVYGIVAKGAAIGRRPPHGQPRPNQLEGAEVASEQQAAHQVWPIADSERQSRLVAELDAVQRNLALRQARGELPPPNPESEVPYAQVAAAWLAAQTTQLARPDYREATPGDNERRFARLQECWPKIVDAAGQRPPAKPLFEAAIPIAVSGNVIVIGYDVEHAFLRDVAERRQGLVVDIIAGVLAESVAVIFQTVPRARDELEGSELP